MLKYFISYVFIYSGLIWSQIINPVSISLESDSTARAGEMISISIDAIMDDQWKIYSIYKIVDGPLPTEISVSGDAVGMVGLVKEPSPIEKFDPGFDLTSYYHSGDTRFVMPVRLKRNLDPGNYDISVSVFFQVCNERLCYPPVTISDTVSVTIESGEPRPGKLILSSSEENDASGDKPRSILSLIILAIGGAILSWVMPCVYPMIPIIISFFGKLSEEKHIGKTTVAVLYGSGIAGTFIVIGLVVSFLSWGMNDAAAQTGYANIGNFIATNAWLNLGLGL